MLAKASFYLRSRYEQHWKVLQKFAYINCMQAYINSMQASVGPFPRESLYVTLPKSHSRDNFMPVQPGVTLVAILCIQKVHKCLACIVLD